MRELELTRINAMLLPEGLTVKEIVSDGNCLYRAVSDQLQSMAARGVSSVSPCSFTELRQRTATFMRENASEFAPFLGMTDGDPNFQIYCDKTASPAEWGGQLEVKALALFLQLPITIYDAESSLIRMGDPDSASQPVIITYHRHYFSLGEHYNSVTLL